MRRGPLLVDMVLTEPAMPVKAKKDLFSRLDEAMAANDAGKVAEVCRLLEMECRASTMQRAGELHSKLKERTRNCSGAFLEALRGTCESVGAEVRQRALAGDRRPEEVRKKADEALLEAAERGDLDGVKRALAYGADVHAKDGRGMTAMLHALTGTGIRFKDLHTTQSSLEDIFVTLVRENK